MSNHLGGGDLADATRGAVAPTVRPAAADFPHLHGDDWGADKQYWVTVYGFPARSKSFILHQFQTLGEVINFTAGAGNWLHIRYYTRLQAEKALSYDGKTLSGNVMIGVKKCYASDLDGVREEPASNIFSSHTRQQNPGSRYICALLELLANGCWSCVHDGRLTFVSVCWQRLGGRPDGRGHYAAAAASPGRVLARARVSI